MFTINATVRNNLRKSANRRLRLKNKIPAIVYGGNQTPVAIHIDHSAILKISSNTNLYKNILTLLIDKEHVKVRILEVQRHPFKPKVTHIDFFRA